MTMTGQHMWPEGTLAYMGQTGMIPALPSGSVFVPSIEALAQIITEVDGVVADLDSLTLGQVEACAADANCPLLVVGTDSLAGVLAHIQPPRVACINGEALWIGPPEYAPSSPLDLDAALAVVTLSHYLTAQRSQRADEDLASAQIASGAHVPFETLVERPKIGDNTDYDELAIRFADWKREWHFVTDTPIGSVLKRVRSLRRKLRKWF